MENFIFALLDKGAFPALIFGFAYLVYKIYIFKSQRYGGRNPYKCPNCRKNSCLLHESYTINGQAAAVEGWKCEECGKTVRYIIH